MICDECETVAHCLKNGCVPKTTKKDEALRLALEALTHGCPPDCKDGMTDSGGIHPWGEAALVPCPNCEAITALRETLAEQPAPVQQEPVSGVVIREGLPTLLRDRDIKPTDTRLYTSPPTLSLAQRQARSADTWVGLTEPEVNDCYESIMFDQNIEPSRMGVYLEIEAKLRSKNT